MCRGYLRINGLELDRAERRRRTFWSVPTSGGTATAAFAAASSIGEMVTLSDDLVVPEGAGLKYELTSMMKGWTTTIGGVAVEPFFYGVPRPTMSSLPVLTGTRRARGLRLAGISTSAQPTLRAANACGLFYTLAKGAYFYRTAASANTSVLAGVSIAQATSDATNVYFYDSTQQAIGKISAALTKADSARTLPRGDGLRFQLVRSWRGD